MEELDVDTSEPSLEEVRRAVHQLKNNKAAGIDRISAELIKSGGEIILQRLHALIVNIWCEERVPEDWQKSELTVLYKKGDTKECKNYRGISLLSVAGKTFAWIILKRIKQEVEARLRENQARFKSGRG